MSQEKNRVVLLATAEKRRTETGATTFYCSAIFADSTTPGLAEVEKNVFSMVLKHPDCWASGEVIGYPESMFSETDREALSRHGLGKRFER